MDSNNNTDPQRDPQTILAPSRRQQRDVIEYKLQISFTGPSSQQKRTGLQTNNRNL